MGRRVGLLAVGVDNVGAALPVLKGAAAGARRVAQWLESQKGFGVECICKLLVDGPGVEVTTRDVLGMTKAFVDGGGLDLLILYFSSHGIVQSANSELILLSGAAGDYPNEAIDIASTVYNARYLNIPHVLVISDACRNAVDPYSQLGSVRGITAVQGFAPAGRRPGKVDIFYATEPSQTAKEYKGDGFFTEVLLETLYQPPVQVCEYWDNYANAVIPTWQLENYLFEQVPMRAADLTPRFEQTPDFTVTSRQPMFLGFAKGGEPAPTVGEDAKQVALELDGEPTVFGQVVLDGEWTWSNGEGPGDLPTTVSDGEADKYRSGIRDKRHALKNAAADFLHSPHRVAPELLERAGLGDSYRLFKWMGHFEAGTSRPGLYIHGCSVVRHLAARGGTYRAVHADPIEVRPPAVWLPTRRHHSITLVLDERSITVLPLFPGYIGHVHVENGVVQDVSFTPGPALGHRLGFDNSDAHELRTAHSVAAAFARTGKLAALADGDALAFAEYLRSTRRIDPTLGVYAAYAYALAGQQKGIDAIYHYFRNYRRASPDGSHPLPIPFDVALLAGKLDDQRVQAGIASFVPMMNLGWSMLANGPSGGSLRLVHSLAEYRLNAEWTTLDLRSERILSRFFNT